MFQKLQELQPDWANTLPRAYIERILTLHAWGVLSVDGLYFLEIEKRYGTPKAVEIDTAVWKAYGRMEGERIKAAMLIESDKLNDVARALRTSSWLFYVPDFKFNIADDGKSMTLTVKDCRIQRKRKDKGLDEFPCKPVGFAYLEEFVKVFNDRISIGCRHCPPDEHPGESWCEWTFEVE
jgi:hypothetical protein